MVLDAVSNFVRGTTDAAVGTSDTTVSVADASIFPDPSTDGEYNVVIWDANNFPRPDQDSDVEIVRVTGRDTGADELTVVRGQETTSDVAHPSGSAVHLSPTAKMFSDIEAEYTAQGENFDGEGTSEFSNLQSVETEQAGIDLHTEQQRERKTKYENYRQRAHRGWQINDLSDATDWDVISGSLQEDADSYAGSGGSLRLTDSNTTEVEIELELDEPIDFRRFIPSVAYRRESPDDEAIDLDIQGFDREGRRVIGAVRIMPGDTTDDWRRADCGFAETDSDLVEPELVERIRIRASRSSETSFDILLDDLRAIERPEQGSIILTFDDGEETHYTEAFDYMSQYGIPGVAGVHTDLIGSSGYMTESQVDEIAEAGWEIASHNPTTTDRSDQLSVEEWKEAQKEAKDWLLERGYTRGARHHIYPSWRVADGILEATSEYHDVAFSNSASNRFATVPGTPTDLLDIPRVDDQNSDIESMMRFVDVIAEYGGVGVFTFHDIGDGTAPSVAEFRDLIDHIVGYGDGIDVITASDLLAMGTDSPPSTRQKTGDAKWHYQGQIDLDGVNSKSLNIAGVWDHVKLSFVRVGDPSATSEVYVRVNGDSTENYDFRTVSDGINTPPTDDKWLVGSARRTSTRALNGSVELSSEGNVGVSIEGPLGGRTISANMETILTGYHSDQTGIESVTILTEDGQTLRGRVEIYGRNNRL